MVKFFDSLPEFVLSLNLVASKYLVCILEEGKWNLEEDILKEGKRTFLPSWNITKFEFDASRYLMEEKFDASLKNKV